MEDATSLVTSIHLIGYTVTIARNFALDKCKDIGSAKNLKVCLFIRIYIFIWASPDENRTSKYDIRCGK